MAGWGDVAVGAGKIANGLRQMGICGEVHVHISTEDGEGLEKPTEMASLPLGFPEVGVQLVWAFLRYTAARVIAWRRHSPPPARSVVAPAPVIAPPTRQRSNQPLLWTAKCSD